MSSFFVSRTFSFQSPPRLLVFCSYAAQHNAVNLPVSLVVPECGVALSHSRGPTAHHPKITAPRRDREHAMALCIGPTPPARGRPHLSHLMRPNSTPMTSRMVRVSTMMAMHLDLRGLGPPRRAGPPGGGGGGGGPDDREKKGLIWP